MLIYFTEVRTEKKVAVSPDHVICVLEIAEGELAGNTLIVMNGGNVAVTESQIDVVGQLNGAV